MWKLLIVGVLVVGGCSDGEDAGISAACREFRAIVDDAQAGVLTDAEMRSRSREVYELAQGSEDREFRDAAAALARDVLDPDSGVIPAFGDQCDEKE